MYLRPIILQACSLFDELLKRPLHTTFPAFCCVFCPYLLQMRANGVKYCIIQMSTMRFLKVFIILLFIASCGSSNNDQPTCDISQVLKLNEASYNHLIDSIKKRSSLDEGDMNDSLLRLAKTLKHDRESLLSLHNDSNRGNFIQMARVIYSLPNGRYQGNDLFLSRFEENKKEGLDSLLVLQIEKTGYTCLLSKINKLGTYSAIQSRLSPNLVMVP